MGSGAKAFVAGFLGKLAGALFIAICLALGFGPDRWAKFIVTGFPTWVTPGLAQAVFATLAAITFISLTWSPWMRLAGLLWRRPNLPTFCSLEEAFTLSGLSDRTAFLEKLRRLCGMGKITALGKKHGAPDPRLMIPCEDWASYRLDFAEGGCAIPEGADKEFFGALSAINLY
jgi:hypothetical protein